MTNLENIFYGVAIGCAVGDVLGRPVEGMSREFIIERYGLLSDIISNRYSDDTEMTIAVMEALCEDPELSPEVLASKFVQNFNPWRGYGPRTALAIRRLKEGARWEEVGTDSWGNGAAMRVSPIGCFFYDDLEKLVEKAFLSAIITHKHPEAIAGALAQALAVALATRWSLARAPKASQELFSQIFCYVKPISETFTNALEKLVTLPSPFPDLSEGSFLLSQAFPCDVSAKGSVPVAIGAFLFTDSFEEALITAINVGGDTDTIGAMTGALAGAYYGLDAIPARWIQGIEDGPKGKSYILNLARRLYEKKRR